MRKYEYSSKDLEINLGELGNEIIREMDITSRKVSIYSSTHPLARKALERSFLQMEKIFKYKKYVNLNIDADAIYALNIRLTDSRFTEYIFGQMRAMSIEDILFESTITIKDLAFFLERFSITVSGNESANLIIEDMEKAGIRSIVINSQQGKHLFKNSTIFSSEYLEDYTLRYIVGEIIGDDPEKLINLLSDESKDLDEYIEEYNMDYYPNLVSYVIPERISSMEPEALKNILNEKIKAIGDLNAIRLDDPRLNKIKNLVAILSYHPDLTNISKEVEKILGNNNKSKELHSEIMSSTGGIMVESSEKIDQFLYTTFHDDLPGYDLDDFYNLFERLIRTGQESRIKSVINILMLHLASSQLNPRAYALILFRHAIELFRKLNIWDIFDYITGKIDEYITNSKETFEFSDLIGEMARICLAEKKYDKASALCDVLSRKIECQNGIYCYNSVVVKKAVEELNRPEVANRLVSEMVSNPNDNIQYIKNIFVTVGSEEMAYALSTIISYNSRRVRMNVLRILPEMGKVALIVCARIVEDNLKTKRSEYDEILPDERWYIIRNAIFILGALKDPEACNTLKYCITDTDTRVRRIIVEALEKVRVGESAELLLLMADDPDKEIREAAIVALGSTGQVEIVPELIDLIERQYSQITRIITTVGMLGGRQAKEFITRILEDQMYLSKLTSDRLIRENIKLAAIKALGRMGDKNSLDIIRNFTNSLTISQRMFHGGSKLRKAADEILQNK